MGNVSNNLIKSVTRELSSIKDPTMDTAISLNKLKDTVKNAETKEEAETQEATSSGAAG